MKTHWLTAAQVALALSCAAAKPWGLTVEYRTDPVGIDVANPRFSWKLPDGMVRQSAYEIDAGSWRTGKVASDESLNAAVWGGENLKPSQRVRWRVRVWDEKDRPSEWSDPAAFVMGRLGSDGGQAKWIGPNRLTRPDVDFGGARWIGGEKVGCDFAWDGSDGVCELVYSCTRPHKIFVNGRLFSSNDGMVYDFRHPRFRDLRPLLRKGTNRIDFELPFGAFKSLAQREPPEEIATLALIRLPGGVRVVSGPDWGGLDLGGARETDWGAELDCREETVSPVFAKTFAVRGKVKAATLHVTGLGFYEASLNGAKVGDKVLDPPPTDYDKRVLYSTYVLDDALREGENELKIELGHGWYDIRSIATWNYDVAPWRDFPRCIARLEIEYADGRAETVVTDGTWRQVVGETAYDCFREGSVIGRKEPVTLPPDLRAEEVPAPKGALVAAGIPGAKVVRRIRPQGVRTLEDGTSLVAFPENVSGWARLRIREQPQGDEITIRYDENLTPEEGVTKPKELNEKWRSWNGWDRIIDIHYRYPASQRFAEKEAGFQIDHFIASGAKEEFYEPKFTFNGFRYLVVRGLRHPLREQDVEACFVRTDFPRIGSFSCSNRTLTELVAMAQNSYLVNFTDGFPTDCAHREKLGWTGDGWIASELAQYFFENTSAYGKWVQDNVDAQRADGIPCSIVPTSGWGYREYNGPTFDAVLATLPWNLYVYRGDRRALDVAWPAICRYIEAESRLETSPGLVANGLGDWNAAVAEHMPAPEYVISANYFHILTLASKIAAVKGLSGEAEKYAALARRTADAINAKYLKADGVYDNGGQTAQALPLVLDFAPPAVRKAVAARLVEAVERADFHVDLGLVGMKHVFRALTIAGRSDLAIRMLTNPTRPSPAFWVGKTSTLWEDFNKGLSKSHIMLGDFAAWSMQHLAGIRLGGTCVAIPEPQVPGFRRFIVAPDTACGLDWAKGAVDGPYGRISSFWRKQDGKAVLEVTVPPNSEAIVRFDGRETVVGPGRHVFGGAAPKTMPLDAVSYACPKARPCAELSQPDVQALWLEGEPWNGKPTEVFAYVGIPAGASATNPVPGVVLAHGGLGTAYLEWVRTWVRHDYAAITIDTCGSIPVRQDRTGHAWIPSGIGGPAGWGRLDLADEKPENQWPYHAVTGIVRAHSYLRSLPAVDAGRTGLTGISWGGFITMLAASADDRFKFAAPVYTSVFDEATCRIFAKNGKPADAVRLDRWLRLWNPAHYVGRLKLPLAWFASTNDHAFPFDDLQDTFGRLPVDPTAVIRPKMVHSHGPWGENMPEIFAFADSVLKEGAALPVVGAPQVADGRFSVAADLKGRTLRRVDLVWTDDAEPDAETDWRVVACPAPADGRFSTAVPSGAKRVFANFVLTGETGEKTYPEALVSSRAVVTEGRTSAREWAPDPNAALKR